MYIVVTLGYDYDLKHLGSLGKEEGQGLEDEEEEEEDGYNLCYNNH